MTESHAQAERLVDLLTDCLGAIDGMSQPDLRRQVASALAGSLRALGALEAAKASLSSRREAPLR